MPEFSPDPKHVHQVLHAIRADCVGRPDSEYPAQMALANVIENVGPQAAAAAFLHRKPTLWSHIVGFFR